MKGGVGGDGVKGGVRGGGVKGEVGGIARDYVAFTMPCFG